MSVRHDWYQTDSKVVITVMLKNATEKNYQVDIGKKSVSMKADNYSLILNLCHPVVPEQSSHKASQFKVEISLTKETGIRWESLEEKKSDELSITTAAPPKLGKQDWDKLATEITKTETDEAASDEKLNDLFQQIYSTSNEDTRRAMNKSFLESGGTVLSTNWKEVGEKKVEVKPPDGAEFKKWDS